MRPISRFFFLACSFLCLACIAFAADIDMTLNVGFNGFYRTGVFVPVIVSYTNNTGENISSVFSAVGRTPSGETFTLAQNAVVIPKNGNGSLRMGFLARRFFTTIQVDCTRGGKAVSSVAFPRCQEVYESDRLLLIVGGSGSTLSFANGQAIVGGATSRPWGFSSSREEYYPMSAPRGSGATPKSLKLSYIDPALMPDNPEAYGSVSAVLLAGDVTENTLPLGAQRALPQWVMTGGRLLIARSEVASRLEAPFFTKLLPEANGKPIAGATKQTGPDGDALSRSFGAGVITLMQFDPDHTRANWRSTSRFIGTLMTIPAESGPIAPALGRLDSMLEPAHLQPPNLSLIILYLVLYLVVLVPVNYFTLKKLDRRELSWITTPAIVLLFTFGAYGIGAFTKGHRLVINTVSIIETQGEQPAAEAVSNMLIYSPARSKYTLNLGERGLLALDANSNRDDLNTGAFPFTQEDGKLTLQNVRVNMWDFRSFNMVHQVDMGGGFKANLTPGTPSSFPRATGTVINNTHYDFALCELYIDGAQVAKFALKRGQSEKVETAQLPGKLDLSNEAKDYYSKFSPIMAGQFSGGGKLMKGFVLIGYTEQPVAYMLVNKQSPTTRLSVVVAHL